MRITSSFEQKIFPRALWLFLLLQRITLSQVVLYILLAYFTQFDTRPSIPSHGCAFDDCIFTDNWSDNMIDARYFLIGTKKYIFAVFAVVMQEKSSMFFFLRAFFKV